MKDVLNDAINLDSEYIRKFALWGWIYWWSEAHKKPEFDH